MIQAAKQPGISIAAVALANGLNANMLRKWVAESEAGRPVVPRLADAKPCAAFVPLALAAPADTTSAVAVDIRVEVRRGTTSVSISWPAASADACASWLRDLLR